MPLPGEPGYLAPPPPTLYAKVGRRRSETRHPQEVAAPSPKKDDDVWEPPTPRLPSARSPQQKHIPASSHLLTSTTLLRARRGPSVNEPGRPRFAPNYKRESERVRDGLRHSLKRRNWLARLRSTARAGGGASALALDLTKILNLGAAARPKAAAGADASAAGSCAPEPGSSPGRSSASTPRTPLATAATVSGM